MYLVGLTGGIAAGKSTVAECWRNLGAIEIDADLLAREAVAPGTKGLAQVVAEFGDEVLSNGELDRKTLARIIFADAVKRARLEAILHPIIKQLASEKVTALADDAIAVYTVPLLIEANVDLPFNKIVTVEAPREAQLERLVKNRGMSPDEANQRLAAQASPAERANRADIILNSNQSLELLIKDATLLWRQIEHEAANGID
jgi:dephospho-CoA kinase